MPTLVQEVTTLHIAQNMIDEQVLVEERLTLLQKQREKDGRA
jgi:hypothetical protein